MENKEIGKAEICHRGAQNGIPYDKLVKWTNGQLKARYQKIPQISIPSITLPSLYSILFSMFHVFVSFM